MRIALTAAGTCLLLSNAALAQNPPRDTAKVLPGVTATATRSTSSPLTTPLATTQITAGELRATNGFGIEDALHLVPGVIAQSRYGTSDVRLVIRGYGARGAGDRSNSGTSRGVRVLIDGFPVTEPDGRTSFDDVDLQTAYGVDVVRSNASSLWGNAAGGVVNISSRPDGAGNSIDMQPMFGAFGLKRLATRTSAQLGESGQIWAALTNTSFDGWRTHSDARRALFNAGASGNLSDKTRLGVYLVATNNLFRIPGPLTQAEMDADPTQSNPTYLARDERRYNRQGRLGFTLDQELSSTASISSMVYVNPKYLQRSERNTYRDFTRYHMGGNVVARKSMDIGAMQHRGTIGIDEAYQDGSIQFYALAANTRGALTDNKGEGAQNTGVFVQDEVTVNDRLSLLLGARYDRVAYNYRTFFNPAATIKSQSRDFTRVSPKLGFTWKVGKTNALYANMGGGVEVPAGNETDQPPTGPLPGALLNPLLEPISSTSVEAGFKSLGMSVLGGKATVGYDVALYNIAVKNEIIPYNGGRYYQTAAAATRRGLEVGVNARTSMGVFASAALTFNDHTYSKYIVDSTVNSPATTGTVDMSGHQVMGVPKIMANVEVGTEVPFYRNLVIRGTVEHMGEYFADDANSPALAIPSYSLIGLKAELREPFLKAGGVGLRGFIMVHNLADVDYIGSAYLNPDLVGGVPAAFEPGMPRAVTVSFTLSRH